MKSAVEADGRSIPPPQQWFVSLPGVSGSRSVPHLPPKVARKRMRSPHDRHSCPCDSCSRESQLWLRWLERRRLQYWDPRSEGKSKSARLKGASHPTSSPDGHNIACPLLVRTADRQVLIQEGGGDSGTGFTFRRDRLLVPSASGQPTLRSSRLYGDPKQSGSPINCAQATGLS